jgi:ParB-like chromosome segregation protein Spo0J
MTLQQAVEVEPTTVDLSSIKAGASPRLKTDQLHARALAETQQALPPILVHRQQMTIIDGAHRYLAHQMRGETTIRVLFFDGDDRSAFILAIRENIGHGKPLTLTERRLAARRVLQMSENLSDRAIADTCGISPKTVGQLRKRSTEESAHSNARPPNSARVARIGRDGRIRPVNSTLLRQEVAQVLTKRPEASLREVAHEVGVSPTTVRSVRAAMTDLNGFGQDENCTGESPAPPQGLQAPKWTLDSACGSTACGAQFAEWFDAHRIDQSDCKQHIPSVPLSRVYDAIDNARAQANLWNDFADALANRVRTWA